MMATFIKKILYLLLFSIQIHKLLRYLNKNKTIILMYHGFTDQNTPFLKFSDGKHLNLKKFESQIKYLKSRYNLLSLEQFIEYHKNNKKLPVYSLIITMDDGYFSNYNLTYPILKKFNIPATIFLTTDFIENKNFLWTDRVGYALAMAKPNRYKLRNINKGMLVDLNNDSSKVSSFKKVKLVIKSKPQKLMIKFVEDLEALLENRLDHDNAPKIYLPLEWEYIKEMINSGLISIGGHSHTHPILTNSTYKDIKKELLLSKKIITKNTKIKSFPFAYPNGTAKDFNEQIKLILKQSGYSCALTTIPGFNVKTSDLFELKRIAIDDRFSRIEFIMNVAGFRSFLNRYFKI